MQFSEDKDLSLEADSDEARLKLLEHQLALAGKEVPVLAYVPWERRTVWFEYNLPELSLPLLAKFGMPVGLPFAMASLPGCEFGPQFKNYWVEMFGIRRQFRKGRKAEQPDGVFEFEDTQQILGLYGVFETPIVSGPDTPPSEYWTLSIHIWRLRLFSRR
jgi:hypothetical protein